MESHIAPASGWTEQQGAAARIATLILMNTSGATVGMQWQPQEQSRWPDEGLWTSVSQPDGGSSHYAWTGANSIYANPEPET